MSSLSPPPFSPSRGPSQGSFFWNHSPFRFRETFFPLPSPFKPGGTARPPPPLLPGGGAAVPLFFSLCRSGNRAPPSYVFLSSCGRQARILFSPCPWLQMIASPFSPRVFFLFSTTPSFFFPFPFRALADRHPPLRPPSSHWILLPRRVHTFFFLDIEQGRMDLAPRH